MDLWNSLGGLLRLELICADPGGALRAISEAGITVYDAAGVDEDITVTFQIRRRDYKVLCQLAQKKGYEVKLLEESGLYWKFKGLLRRPVLVAGLLGLCLLALYLPSRIFFIRVEGNVSVPTRLILEKCYECGIGFGSSRKEVRSQKMKDALLEAVPELQWAGINTAGCVATVTVRERSEEPVEEMTGTVSSIVALRDGIITECTVTRGSAVCRVGQAVRAGELLVSGYTDCGILIQATRAEAEVFAQTQRDLTAIIPTNWVQTGQNRVTEKKYAIIIGKKRINFYKSSGISGTTCDKMYSESYVTLPGGFELPIVLVTEEWSYADAEEAVLAEEEARRILEDFAGRYLREQMTAGQILESRAVTLPEEGAYRLEGKYACTEMIGQIRDEEIIKPNGKYD